jgi:hypothetical protein
MSVPVSVQSSGSKAAPMDTDMAERDTSAHLKGSKAALPKTPATATADSPSGEDEVGPVLRDVRIELHPIASTAVVQLVDPDSHQVS